LGFAGGGGEDEISGRRKKWEGQAHEKLEDSRAAAIF
jgi:hypothetical protein